MKINNKMKTSVCFENIDVGQVFVHKENIFMRTENSYENDFTNEYYNVVCLSDGKLYYFSDITTVLPVEAELIIR